VADYVPDLIVMLDVVLHMWCLALVQFDGTVRRVVTDSSEIRRHFLRTPRFLISALVLCPLDILAPATGWLLLFRYVYDAQLSSVVSVVLLIYANVSTLLQTEQDDVLLYGPRMRRRADVFPSPPLAHNDII
jgi:hypothetical protein